VRFHGGLHLNSLQGMPVTVVHPFLIASARLALQPNDARPDGLGHSPCEHPPRMPVCMALRRRLPPGAESRGPTNAALPQDHDIQRI